MKFDNERDWLLDRLTKIPALGLYLRISRLKSPWFLMMNQNELCCLMAGHQCIEAMRGKWRIILNSQALSAAMLTLPNL